MAGNTRNKRKSAGVQGKLISKTPILIRHSAAEAARMKAHPYLSLARFRGEEIDGETKPNGHDWRTLYFRSITCFELATKYFKEEETVKVGGDTMLIMLAIKDRYLETKVWRASSYELDAIHTCLLMVDQMQDNTTRKEQLPIWIKANKIIETFNQMH